MPDLHPDLEHLAFLLGTWRGLGVVGYPTMQSTGFEQEVVFEHDGRAFLAYRSRSWLLDEDGVRTAPSALEQGYWRPGVEPRSVQVLLAHPTGHAEIYVGEVAFTRIELVSDLVATTENASPVSGLRRLYGLVPGDGDARDLGYAIDMAAGDNPLQSHASATLRRVVSVTSAGEESAGAEMGDPHLEVRDPPGDHAHLGRFLR